MLRHDQVRVCRGLSIQSRINSVSPPLNAEARVTPSTATVIADRPAPPHRPNVLCNSQDLYQELEPPSAGHRRYCYHGGRRVSLFCRCAFIAVSPRSLSPTLSLQSVATWKSPALLVAGRSTFVLVSTRFAPRAWRISRIGDYVVKKGQTSGVCEDFTARALQHSFCVYLALLAATSPSHSGLPQAQI